MHDDLVATMPFSKLMGLEVLEATTELVHGSLTVRPEHCTIGGILHGGAVRALADALGAIAALLNLPEGAGGTTTIETKTNFFAAAPEGTTVHGKTTAVHIGRRGGLGSAWFRMWADQTASARIGLG
jgi:1,4-dihydroxy-2-naphthoyl-CoA hydrolase